MTKLSGKEVAEAWIKSADARDGKALMSMLSDKVVLRPPFQTDEVHGTSAVLMTFAAVANVTADFQYGRTWVAENSIVLEFSATINGHLLHGVDIVELDGNGKMTKFDVLARPSSSVVALGVAVTDWLKAHG